MIPTNTQALATTKAPDTDTTIVIPTDKSGYEKMITLKRHVVDIKESIQGVVTVVIVPISDNVMDSTLISHDPDEDIVRVSTSRDLRTDAKSITTMYRV